MRAANVLPTLNSDQQILTGISILTAGYAKTYTINVYHWQVLVYLAWMSSGTHLITLSVLRKHMREKKILRVFRVGGMLILFVMLFIAIVTTGSETYYEIVAGNLGLENNNGEYHAFGVPSVCFWNRKYWNGWRWNTGLSYLLLISSYTARAAALFERSETYFRSNIRDRLLGRLEKALDRNIKHIQDRVTHRRAASWVQKLRYNTYLATYAVILACLELYSSFVAPLTWLLLSLLWGSLQMLYPRMILAQAAKSMIKQPDAMAVSEENIWGVGQVLPLMLLTLPLLAAVEAYYGRSFTDRVPGVWCC